LDVEVLPGPTAFVPALLLSGFPPAHFVFYGFLPRTKGKRIKILKSFENFPGPVIYYESPFRVKALLSDIREALGDDREVALVRELTKIYEETIRGKVLDVENEIRDRKIKGEIVVVVNAKHK